MAQAPQEKLPQVLVIRPPAGFKTFEERFSKKFQFVKAWESSLSIDLFLSNHALHVTALLCSAGTRVTSDLLRKVPSIRLIVTTSAGLNHIDLTECRCRGISVADAGDVFSEDVADTAVGLFMDVLRKITSSDRYVRRGLWTVNGEYSLGSKLQGKRVGIVGYGSIGSEVAKRLEAFSCIILYNSRKKKPYVPYPFFPTVSELATNSDALIICCALNDQTHHMVNDEVMSALGREGVIVNVARGGIIDEKEMVRFLREGELKGAGLDVFENEPSVPKELFQLDNVVLSPHAAAFSEESFLGLCELMAANLEAFFSGKPLLTPVMDFI